MRKRRKTRKSSLKLKVKENYVIPPPPPSYHWLGFSRLRDSRIFLLAFQDISDRVALPLPTFKNDAMCLNLSWKGIIDKLIPLKLSYSGYYCSMTVGSRFQCKVTRIESCTWSRFELWMCILGFKSTDSDGLWCICSPESRKTFRWNSNASNIMLNRYFYDKGCV